MLSERLPTIIFGDSMQGVFNFRDSPSVSWHADVNPHFPLVGTLTEPMRWRDTNVELGDWIAMVREKLKQGLPIDLSTGPLTYLPCQHDREVGPLFHETDATTGSIAAIHCYRDACNQLAKSTGGFYQAIEDVACLALQDFARKWDTASGSGRVDELRNLIALAVYKKKLLEGESDSEEDAQLALSIQSAFNDLSSTGDAGHAVLAIDRIRRHSRTRSFRGELIRDTAKALTLIADGKFENLSQSAFFIRQLISHGGRFMPHRTVSTPLLLKGLEFDHVVVPDANHFNSGSDLRARAKLFYVALSRARQSLVVASSSPIVQFPIPE